jgi:hypothetical protein
MERRNWDQSMKKGEPCTHALGPPKIEREKRTCGSPVHTPWGPQKYKEKKEPMEALYTRLGAPTGTKYNRGEEGKW